MTTVGGGIIGLAYAMVRQADNPREWKGALKARRAGRADMHPFRNFNDDFIALKDVHIWAFVRIRVNYWWFRN